MSRAGHAPDTLQTHLGAGGGAGPGSPRKGRTQASRPRPALQGGSPGGAGTRVCSPRRAPGVAPAPRSAGAPAPAVQPEPRASPGGAGPGPTDFLLGCGLRAAGERRRPRLRPHGPRPRQEGTVRPRRAGGRGAPGRCGTAVAARQDPRPRGERRARAGDGRGAVRLGGWPWAPGGHDRPRQAPGPPR